MKPLWFVPALLGALLLIGCQKDPTSGPANAISTGHLFAWL
jgi:hypothetical protein